MMRMKPMMKSEMSPKKNISVIGREEGGSEKVDWELRPGGMLVQKRNPDDDRELVPPAPTIRVRVKHGSSYHEIYINSRATFGELKKMLAAPTGLHPQDQKLLFKDKERDSKAYLDVVGVKERSKIVLVEDPTSQERRYIEMRKTAKMEKASKSISEISLEVDRLAGQVSALESVISKGGKVPETSVLNVIELLMNQLIKLDGIIVDGDVKLQRKLQVKRVQKYVETLDLLKVRNSMSSNNGAHRIPVQNGIHQTPVQNGVHQTPVQNGKHSAGRHTIPVQQQQQRQQQPQSQRQSATEGVVVTTKWETFDLLSPPLIPHSSTSTPTTTTTSTANKLNWELFE
ncbi:hypothetical protein AQUCO_01300418v1 [Aquilegia coerulea]|uniref:Ubiquitin-like domain-containing protein n=1 Tax=Aquilegia coerulea TaxID=218851 RepID=A0A2G5E1L0_AQUCA|nr:hypothetical protein AQUCO_01300418v1 [Aquilegia coerulea]